MATYGLTELKNQGLISAVPAKDLSVGSAQLGTVSPAEATIPNAIVAPSATAGTATAPTASSSFTATPSMATAGGYSAAPANVLPETMTVSGQLKTLLESESPLMKIAGTRAKQEANARGLIDSTMAVQAGESAMYGAAMPIAQQDAQTYANYGLASQSAENQARQFGAGAQTQVSLSNSAAGTAISQFNAGLDAELSKFNASLASDISKTNAALYTDVAKKNVENALQAGIVNQETASRLAQFNATQLQEASKFNAANKSDMAKFNIEKAVQAGIINQQQANDIEKFNVSQANTLLAQQIDNEFKNQLSTADAQTRIQLQQMQGDIQKSLANIQADYQTLMQTSSSASSLFTGTINEIGRVVSDANMNATAKASAINGMVGRMKTAMNMIGSINGVDLTGLLDFGTVA